MPGKDFAFAESFKILHTCSEILAKCFTDFYEQELMEYSIERTEQKPLRSLKGNREELAKSRRLGAITESLIEL